MLLDWHIDIYYITFYVLQYTQICISLCRNHVLNRRQILQMPIIKITTEKQRRIEQRYYFDLQYVFKLIIFFCYKHVHFKSSDRKVKMPLFFKLSCNAHKGKIKCQRSC